MISLFRNKKGNPIFIIGFFVLLITIMFVGVMMAFGSAVIIWTADIIVPELEALGVIDGTNLTDVIDKTVGPIDSVIQSFTWLTGLAYMAMIIFIIAFSVSSRFTVSKWLIGFYFVMVIFVFFMSVLMSNIYEEVYNGTDEFAEILRDHTLLSFMILYSPLINIIISFVAGIFIFSGAGREFS